MDTKATRCQEENGHKDQMPGRIQAQKPPDAKGNMATKQLDTRKYTGTKATRCKGEYGHKITRCLAEYGHKTSRCNEEYGDKRHQVPKRTQAQNAYVLFGT